jgi:small subunit ribosomal protein S20
MAKLKTGRHTSALKAHRQSLKHEQANRARKVSFRTALKTFRSTLRSGDVSKAKSLLPQTMSLIDRAAKKGVIHQSAASRHIANISRALHQTKN